MMLRLCLQHIIIRAIITCTCPVCRGSADTKMQPGTGTLTQGGLQELEDRIRDAVRAKRSVSEDSVTLLSRLFK